jgi:stage V sporulation protein SpoVS
MTAHVQQGGLGALAQGAHIHALRDREQDVTRPHPLTGAVERPMGGMVPPTGLFGRFRHHHALFQQRLNRLAGRFAQHAVIRRRIGAVKQALGDGSLSQQLRAGALAKLFVTQQGHRLTAKPRH